MASVDDPFPDQTSPFAMLKPILFALLALAAPAAMASPLDDGVGQLEAQWAQANYSITGKAAQAAAFDQVVSEAAALAARFPASAEPLVWKAVAETAKAHQGHVELESTVGRGSTFHMVLPGPKR